MKTKTQNSAFSNLVKDQVIYNLWANTRLVEWLKTKPAELLEKEIPSSFPSLRETLLHIWDVERGWLGHLKQKPVEAFRFTGYNGTLENIIENLLRDSQELMQYVNALPEEEILSRRFFSIPYVGDHTVPAFEIIQHTINHSTYHRGQLTSMGRQLGFTDAPMTDYMFYVLRAKPELEKIKAAA